MQATEIVLFVVRKELEEIRLRVDELEKLLDGLSRVEATLRKRELEGKTPVARVDDVLDHYRSML